MSAVGVPGALVGVLVSGAGVPGALVGVLVSGVGVPGALVGVLVSGAGHHVVGGGAGQWCRYFLHTPTGGRTTPSII